jgi:hypothetical protein
VVGTTTLRMLARSELATREDLDLLGAGWDAVLADVPRGDQGYELDQGSSDV